MALYLKKLFMIDRNYVQSFILWAKSAQFGSYAVLLSIMLNTSPYWLCPTDYAKNYAGIMGTGLILNNNQKYNHFVISLTLTLWQKV